MAAINHWLRLWHDMPSDPKWRTIARASGRSISEVMAIYCHLLVMASQNSERGHVDGIECHAMSHENVTAVTDHEINFLEGLSTSLDLEIEHVESVLYAMQGRVLAGNRMTGWEGRQPLREDSSTAGGGAKSPAQRKREQRQRQKQQGQNPESHDESRDVTSSHDREEEIREEKPIKLNAREFFPMPLEDWEPDQKTFRAIAFKNSVPATALTPERLAKFCSYWHVRPEKEQSQAQWEYQLVDYLNQQIQFAANSEGKANGNAHPDKTQSSGQGQRAGNGGRKLSAPEQVQQAIAEQRAARDQARETAEDRTVGTALDDHDGDLRPPLDVEFRRVAES